MKSRNAGISRKFAKYAGISRNFAEYHGISRNITDFRGSCRMCPCVSCIPIHIITINIESFLGCHISHSLGLYLRQLLIALRARALAKFGEVDTVPVSEKYTKHRGTFDMNHEIPWYSAKFRDIPAYSAKFRDIPAFRVFTTPDRKIDYEAYEKGYQIFIVELIKK